MAHIQFINHASILVSDKNGILTDPWYAVAYLIMDGGFFMKHQKMKLNNFKSDNSYLDISRTSRSLFTTIFLNIKKIIDRKIKILFQHTKIKGS